ncbi:MAG: TetR/AcrR family transcriptional regulator [Caulobacterales bacterium]
MPRIAGQIDRVKNEAILNATSEVLFERGLTAPLDEIARRAGVSKQTIYNHYGSKAELVKALIERRVTSLTAPLDVPGADAFPEAALASYARGLLETVTMERGVALFRLIIESVPASPELAQAVFAAGPGASRSRLAAFLQREARLGRLKIDNPTEAAEFFAGMVISQHQMQALLGLPSALTAERLERIATEAARRFMRAYAP